jgi:hypothetical protein
MTTTGGSNRLRCCDATAVSPRLKPWLIAASGGSLFPRPSAAAAKGARHPRAQGCGDFGQGIPGLPRLRLAQAGPDGVDGRVQLAHVVSKRFLGDREVMKGNLVLTDHPQPDYVFHRSNKREETPQKIENSAPFLRQPAVMSSNHSSTRRCDLGMLVRRVIVDNQVVAYPVVPGSPTSSAGPVSVA